MERIISIGTRFAIGSWVWRSVPLWAAGNGIEESYLLDGLFLAFFALIVVTLISFARGPRRDAPKRPKKDMLQRHFLKLIMR